MTDMYTDEGLIDRLSLAPDTSLVKAIERLSGSPSKMLLVRDPAERLIGIVTDHDIRRALLDGLEFEAALGQFMNRHPITVPATMSDDDVAALMLARSLSHLPVLDDLGRVVRIRFVHEFMQRGPVEQPRDPVAVVMAGGFGTRLRPLTDTVPKPMLPVGGRPMLFIVLDQILNEGFKRVWVTLHYRAEDIASALNEVPRYREHVECVIEEKPLGTAGGLTLLPERPVSPFLVMNADLLCEVPLAELRRFHQREGNVATLATREDHYEVPFGVVETEGTRITTLREKPRLSYRINTGVYILSPAVLDRLQPDQAMPMTTLLDRLMAEGGRIGSFPVHERWLDIGTPNTLAEARGQFGPAS